MSAAIELHRLALNASTSLCRLEHAWNCQDNAHAARFYEAMLSFVGSMASPHTRRSYGTALGQFWGWCLTHLRASPLPDRIERKHAFAYARYLVETPEDGRQLLEQLEGQPGSELDAAILRGIVYRAGRRIDEIRGLLLSDEQFTVQSAPGRVLCIESDDPHGLDRRLASMAAKRLLRRQPSVAELRARRDGARVGIDTRPDPSVFRYFPPTSAPRSPTTVAQRLGVLSSFWTFLAEQTAENSGEGALLVHNVWKRPLKTAVKRVGSHERVGRAKKTPDLELFVRVLATTYAVSHGAVGPDAPITAAAAALSGADASLSAVANPPLSALRDRALLLFMVLTGCRSDEVRQLRWAHLDGTEPTVATLHGKGGRVRQVQVPPAALRALEQYRCALEGQASLSNPRARIQLLAQPDAPVFSALKRWGRHDGLKATTSAELRGLTQGGIAAMMRRRALAAQIEEAALPRLHPHGLRHLAAHAALERGVPLPTIQSVLGHASLATTGIYVEEHDGAPSLVPTTDSGYAT